MWLTDREKFHFTKKEKREDSFVCGFLDDNFEIIIHRFAKESRPNLYYKYKARIIYKDPSNKSFPRFESRCFGNDLVNITKEISLSIDQTFESFFSYKKSESINNDLLLGLINKDIIMAFNKGE
jgi:hypothetical protein